MTEHSVTFTLNGERREARVDPRIHLGDFLRHSLGLTGTHLGCEHGVCGACTVIVDGAPVRSCLMLAVQIDGARCRNRREPWQTRRAVSAPAGIRDQSWPAMRILHAREC